MNSEIASKLTLIFRDVLDDESIELDDSTTASDIDGWDSLAHIRLVLTVEQSFGIKFSAKEVNAMKNVGEFVGLIELKLS